MYVTDANSMSPLYVYFYYVFEKLGICCQNN